MNLENLIYSAKKSIFRFESFQDYSAEDGIEIIRNYSSAGDLGVEISKISFWSKIKDFNRFGINTTRVRLIKEPLNDYTKWELAALKVASEYSSDRVLIIHQDDFKKLHIKQEDFYIIDEQKIVRMKYEGLGECVGYEEVFEDKEKYLKSKDLIVSKSIDIFAFRN